MRIVEPFLSTSQKICVVSKDLRTDETESSRRGLNPRSPDSKSGVITTTPQEQRSYFPSLHPFTPSIHSHTLSPSPLNLPSAFSILHKLTDKTSSNQHSIACSSCLGLFQTKASRATFVLLFLYQSHAKHTQPHIHTYTHHGEPACVCVCVYDTHTHTHARRFSFLQPFVRTSNSILSKTSTTAPPTSIHTICM